MTRGEPETSFVHANGTDLALYDWGGDGPTVLLIHATGLCARVWDPIVATLPDGPRVLALDLRGHGQSPPPDPIPPRFDWNEFGRDIAGLLDVLGLEDVTVVGHSMGAHSAVIAALTVPERVSRLLLFDPALAAAPPSGTPAPPVAAEQPSARRRAEWASPDEFFERLSGQPPFASWEEAALRAYTTHGLTRDASTGRYHLACPPLFEASVYANRHTASLDDVLGHVRARVSVVRARDRQPGDPPGLGPSATRVESVAAFPVVRDRQLPSASHFFPLETPALAAGLVMEALAW